MNGSGRTQILGLIIRTGFMVNRITPKLMRIVLFCGKQHTGTGMILLASLMPITSVNDYKYAKLFICSPYPFRTKKKIEDTIGLVRGPLVFFAPYIISTLFCFHIFWLRAHLKKVISEPRRAP